MEALCGPLFLERSACALRELQLGRGEVSALPAAELALDSPFAPGPPAEPGRPSAGSGRSVMAAKGLGGGGVAPPTLPDQAPACARSAACAREPCVGDG